MSVFVNIIYFKSARNINWEMITKQKTDREEVREDKNSVFACLAHDLKTPICAQTKILDLILGNNFGRITRAQREVFLELRKSCVYMENLVRNVVSVYSFENNQMYLRKEYFDVREVINETVSEICSISAEKYQVLTYITESFSSYITADKIQIRRCIVNLVSNAIT